MNGLIIWVIIGFVLCLLFFRKGGMSGMSGMGCCGGRHDHGHNSHDRKESESDIQDSDKIIDLSKDQYTVTETTGTTHKDAA